MLFYLCYLTWLIIMFCCVDFKLHLEFSGAPLDWFKSYLSARSQRVFIPGALSDNLPLHWGVPQGSCLGPLLYIIYFSKLFNIIERHLPNSHCYAGVSLIYLSFKPDDLSSQQTQDEISRIRKWKLNVNT